jgi:hypothetical protein
MTVEGSRVGEFEENGKNPDDNIKKAMTASKTE